MKARAMQSGPYIQEGNTYKVIRNKQDSFTAVGPDGIEFYCLWQGCAHLDGGSWERVDEGESTEI